jgi:hypothetical protein
MWMQLCLGEGRGSYPTVYRRLYLIYFYTNNMLFIFCMTASVGQLEQRLYLKFCGGKNNGPFPNIVHSRNKIIQRKEESVS